MEKERKVITLYTTILIIYADSAYFRHFTLSSNPKGLSCVTLWYIAHEDQGISSEVE